MCRNSNSKKLKAISSNRPKFLVISLSDKEVLKKLSSFAIQKGLIGLARGVKTCYNNKKWFIVGGVLDRETFQISS